MRHIFSFPDAGLGKIHQILKERPNGFDLKVKSACWQNDCQLRQFSFDLPIFFFGPFSRCESAFNRS
jgi:hypothetical protein